MVCGLFDLDVEAYRTHSVLSAVSYFHNELVTPLCILLGDLRPALVVECAVGFSC